MIVPHSLHLNGKITITLNYARGARNKKNKINLSRFSCTHNQNLYSTRNNCLHATVKKPILRTNANEIQKTKPHLDARNWVNTYFGPSRQQKRNFIDFSSVKRQLQSIELIRFVCAA